MLQHQDGSSSCTISVTAEMLLLSSCSCRCNPRLQHPRSPSIGNGAGVGCGEWRVQQQVCSRGCSNDSRKQAATLRQPCPNSPMIGNGAGVLLQCSQVTDCCCRNYREPQH